MSSPRESTTTPGANNNAPNNSNAGTMVAALCQAAEHKQGQLRQEVSSNQGHTMAAAHHVMLNGTLQRLLESLGPDVVDVPEIQQFFEEQRERLKQVAARNADNERTLMAMGHACQQVRQDSLRRASAHEAMPEDFTEVISGLVADHAENLVNHRDVVKFVRDVKIKLKEEKDVILGGGDDDDDIEVVDDEGTGGATQGHGLKCPITQMLLEDPYRNTKCGHVYSHAAILDYLKTQRSNRRACKCPTAGCNNTNVSESQLKKDDQAAIEVNRERRRMDKQQEDRASQASQIDDDDDDDNEGDGETEF